MSTTDLTETKEIWKALFPLLSIPADEQWTLWLLRHDSVTVKDGLCELAAKRARLKGAMDAEYMVRFASSVMNRLTREAKQGAA